VVSRPDKHLFPEANGAVIFQGQGPMPYQPVIHVSHLGDECCSGGADEVTFDGTLANLNSGDPSCNFYFD
jgi:hypothetical protein